MGFFSKIGKGIKSAFKKIGKGIKRGLKSVGKFMDKIGIVGQIGLSLLLPGIGGILAGGFSSAFSAVTGAMTGYAGIGSSVINAAGGFLKAAGTVVGNMSKAFSSVTGAIKNVVGETLKFGANKLGLGKVATSLGSTFGSQGLTDLGTSISKASFDNITTAFGEGVTNITDSFSNVFNTNIDPMKGLTDIKDTGVNTQTTTPSADALREQASTQIQQLKDSGMSLDAIKQEIPSEYLDLVDPVQQGVTIGGDMLPDTLNTVPQDSLLNPVQQGVMVGGDILPDTLDTMASDFELQRQKALTTKLPAVGDKNYVLDKMKEVQSGLAEKLRQQAVDVREGFTAFREDPLGVSAGYAVDQLKTGVDSGLQQVGMQGIASAAGIDLMPDQIQQNISTYVAPGEAVQVRPAAQVTPEYFSANQSTFNQYPWGASSALIDSNYYQNLNTTMQRMG
jgi:hypothetical protein